MSVVTPLPAEPLPDPNVAPPAAMSRRDTFAAYAMMGWLGNPGMTFPPTSDADQYTLAYHCFHMAVIMDHVSQGQLPTELKW